MTELKKVKALNDFIAVLREVEVPDGIEIDPDAVEKISNEGVVVGVGPDAAETVEIGDRIIHYPKKYLAITPASGGYEGKTVVLIRRLDAVACIGKTDKYTFKDEV
jgi:hypothetical protein